MIEKTEIDTQGQLEQDIVFADEIAQAFIAAITLLRERQPKKIPTRIEKLQQLFKGREDSLVSF